ncbi:MAG: GTP pyrophosphokinase family protein [Clostridiales bacterium]|nr:GTP pyrophosphokinase family protein [Clostridiales bacterium]
MELPMLYNETEELKRALMLYDSALKEINTKLEILNNEFKLAHQYNPIEHITSRLKTPKSIAKKLQRYERDITVENIIKYINDVAGIRIICSFTSDIYRIADLISKQSDIKVLKIKDYIANPKPNGYTSYHMIVTIPVFLSDMTIDTKVEIQIRTIAMDFWASLEHKIHYKFEGNAPDHIRNELKECAELVTYLDQRMLSINEEVQRYNSNPLDDFNRDVIYSSEVVESIGNISEDDKDEKDNKKKKRKKKKSGKNRMLLGFGA